MRLHRCDIVRLYNRTIMRRLRVCQLITELGPAGAERCVYELSRRLDKDRFDVQVVALRDGEVAEWLEKAGIKVTVLGVHSKFDVIKLGKLARLLRREQIDLLHTHLFHADLAGRPAAYLADVPHVVHTIHVAEARFRPWQFAYSRLMANACDRLICVSDSVYEFHPRRTGLPNWRYSVIPNGIDANAFTHDTSARKRLRKEWGLSDDQPCLAFVGRLDYQKGIDTLMAAVSHLGARGAPIDLVVAGNGSQRRIVSNFIKHGEGGSQCRMLGFVSDVRSLLSAADLVVMPSRWEGLPIVAVEAMSAGLPVIATRVAGLKEVVVDGETGLLIEPNNGAVLADTIESLLGDAELRKKLGQAGRARVLEHYSIAANIAAHEKLYEEIAADLLCG